MEITRGRVRKPEDTSTEVTQTEEEKRKRFEKKKNSA